MSADRLPPDPGQAEWYARGLRFECTQCGRCCTGPPGYVGVTAQEAQAIADRLGLTLDAFYAQHAQRTRDGWSLGEVKTEHGYDCVFLDRTTLPGRAVCGIYEDRPTQCRTFPWWPENLRTRRRWEALGRTCEGVGRGAVVPIEAIRVQRAIQQRTDDARESARDS
jgi:Fe-S-cluster containining protein